MSTTYSHSQKGSVISSSPLLELKCSLALVIWICRASFCISPLCLRAQSTTDVSSQLMVCWFSHTCSASAGLSIIPLLQAFQCSLILVSSLVSPQLWYNTLDQFSSGNASFTLVNTKQRVHPDLLNIKFPADCLISSLKLAIYGIITIGLSISTNPVSWVFCGCE